MVSGINHITFSVQDLDVSRGAGKDELNGDDLNTMDPVSKWQRTADGRAVDVTAD